MSGEDMALPETHIERMDRLRFEAEQAERRLRLEVDRDKAVARERRKGDRKGVWIAWAVALAAVAIICTAIYAWWIDDDPPQTPEDFRSTEAGREAQCIEAGGGWVPGSLFYNDNNGLCVFPGQSVEVPGE